ncbi:hypothetical protein BDF14DRAFT_1768909 [Spinellus fusiger]|nr:hypothetical protein BDF14DRAFT_1768909 [Spinellus fusiger]
MNVETLFSVNGKVVLVTGGSRGIGEMIATGYVQAGAKVYISSRSVENCEKVAAKLSALGPGQCISLPTDLEIMENVKSLVAELSKREKYLDVLVNNAGVVTKESINTYSSSDFQKILNLNVTRVFSLTQACLPLLRSNATADNPSRVINIGSIHGKIVPIHETYAYSASKAAVHHLTRHLAARLGREHILVNAIAPGPFPSQMMEDMINRHGEMIKRGLPVSRFGTTEDIAGTCIYLSSRAGQYNCGSIIYVDGGGMLPRNKL